MSQFVEAATKTFTAGTAIDKYLRVILTAGKLALAGVADRELGVLEEEAFADGDVRAVRLRSAQGTTKMVAAGAITAGAVVYAAASGKIDDTFSTVVIGIALEAATANNDVIEVLRNAAAGFDASVATSTTSAAGSTQGDAAALSDGFNLVSAANGTKGVILPTGVTGRSVTIKNNVGSVLAVYPHTAGTINALAANTSMAMASSAAAEFVCYNGTAWYSVPLLPS